MKKLISSILVSTICLIWIQTNAQTITNFTVDNGLPDNTVNCVAVDSDDKAWFGTQNGVAIYDQGDWSYYTTNDGLINNVINCIAINNQDNVWVGTDFGVSTFDGISWISYTTADGLGNNWTYYINVDDDENVWIGTIVGLSRFDNDGNWTNYGIADGLMSGVCNISFDSQGVLWLGTFTAGMVKFVDMEFVPFTTDEGLLNNFNILSIAIDDQDYKWVATPLGISVFNQNDQWYTNYEMEDGLFTEAVKDLVFDSQGNLWVGNYTDYLNQGAVNKFDGSNWEYFVVDQAEPIDSLISIVVRRLAVDSKDDVWVATGNGVSKISYGASSISINGPATIHKIYPIPANDLLNIEVVNTSDNTRTVEIFNLSSQKIAELKLPAYSNRLTIPLNSYKAGIYFVKIEHHISKFIVH